MLEVSNRNFDPGQAARIEWRHIASPAGQSRTWFVDERSTNATVATAFGRIVELALKGIIQAPSFVFLWLARLGN
jgi:hypothetical protein